MSHRESWFSKLTQQRLRRGAFCSVQELVAAIKDYLTHHNAEPKPFVWSTTADAILEKVGKCKVIIGTHHYVAGCSRDDAPGMSRRVPELGDVVYAPLFYKSDSISLATMQ